MSSKDVTEILLCLAGLDCRDSSKTNRDASERCETRDKLLLDLQELASHHAAIKTTCTRLHDSKSVVVRVVAAEVQRQLHLFQDKVVNIESMVIRQHADITVENETSLIRLKSMLSDDSRILTYLQDVVVQLSAVDDPEDYQTPAVLLHRLRLDILTGYDHLRIVTSALLENAERIFMLQLKKWCLHAKLYSAYSEDFFVQYRHDTFVFEARSCPNYIDISLAERVYSLGILWKRLQHENSQVDDKYRNELIKRYEAILSRVSIPLQNAALSHAIDTINKSVGQDLLTSILPKSTVLHLFQFLQDYYLLENGEFALRLIEETQTTFRSLSRNIGTLRDSTVQAVLARVTTSLQDYEIDGDEAVLHCSMLHMRLNTEPLGASDFSDLVYGISVRLCFDNEWPFNLILSEHDLDTYRTLFDYLIAIRRAHERLHGLWRARRGTSISNRTWSSANIVRSFLGTLLEYYHVDIIKQVFIDIRDCFSKPEEIYSFDILANRHRKLLETACARILLLRSHHFRRIMRRLLLSIEGMVAAIERSAEDVNRRCTETTTIVDEALQDLLLEEDLDILLLKLQNNSSLIGRYV